MKNTLQLKYISTKEDIDFFWTKRTAYQNDINVFAKPKLSLEHQEYFASNKYKEHIMKLFYRMVDPLHIVFLMNNDEYCGFLVYVTYHSEDHKCFIIDYCIDPSKRGNHLGHTFFLLFEEKALQDDAEYFALNTSNENNTKFWLSNGFKATIEDEHNCMIYVKEKDVSN